MKKVNKSIVCTWIIFIALMLSSVFATSDEAQDTSKGSMDNPFVIAISGGSGRSQKFKFDKFPFYFKTQVPGSYEVSVDSSENEVTFTLIDNDINNIIAVIDEESGKNIDNKQLGIEYRNVDKAAISTPQYDISEIVIGKTEFNKTSRALRSLQLINIAPNASLLATRSNLYFFTNANEKLLEEQLEEIRRKGTGKLAGDWSGYYQYRVIVDDILYECKGHNNSALSSAAADKNSIEAIVTRLFISIGDNFLLKSIRSIFGNSNISINTLIFNKFELTKLDLYDSTSSRTD